MSMVELKNVTKQYGPFAALKGVSFSVEKGEVVGFLGPNGAGKTTTMRIITGYLPASSGSVKVGGVDVQENSLAVRAKIGYLPEANPLYLGMEVRPFLLFISRLMGVSSKERDSHVKEIIQACGLTKVANKTIKKLSRGYRQRVGLAQALIGNPDLLILDEPTVGLDPNQIIEIRQLIRRLGKEKGRAVILSTHILKEVAEVCDRVVIINDGKIVASDTPEHLTKETIGSERVHVRIQGAPERAEAVLKAIPGASAVSRPLSSQGETAGQTYDFTVDAAKGTDLRPAVSKAVVEAGLGLIEVRVESVDLEEVFAKLTGSTKTSR